jgi:phosphoglycerate dehydrogenase-like enzyme
MAQGLQVVSTFPFSPASQAVLSEAAGKEILCLSDSDEFEASLGEADVLCAYKVPTNWRELAPRLRWLQASGAGVDGLRMSGILAADSGVQVTTAVGIHATTIGEYVFASMLMYNRSWPTMVRLQDQRIWPRSANWYKLGGRELAGQTLGIIGLGSIGQRVAFLGQAFGMRVLATRRTVQAGAHQEHVDQLYPMTQLHAMLSECDYVVVAVPLTAETEHLLGEAEFQAMRQHAYLVNVARGRVVDERALVRALREGWIGGAGLDVTEEEPLPAESPLYTLANVILTPHISGESVHYDQRLATLFVKNLRRYRAGQPLQNRYDPARGY